MESGLLINKFICPACFSVGGGGILVEPSQQFISQNPAIENHFICEGCDLIYRRSENYRDLVAQMMQGVASHDIPLGLRFFKTQANDLALNETVRTQEALLPDGELLNIFASDNHTIFRRIYNIGFEKRLIWLGDLLPSITKYEYILLFISKLPECTKYTYFYADREDLNIAVPELTVTNGVKPLREFLLSNGYL